MGVGQLIRNAITADQKAVANGVATLDSNAKVPKNQIDLDAADVGAIATETDPTVASFTKGLTSNNSILTALNAASGTISASVLPSYVDDFLTFTNLALFPVTGETGKIYLAEDTNLSYRWTGSSYVDISSAGTADQAVKLATPRTISATGDAGYSVSFDGSANVSSAIILATVNGNVGGFGSATQSPVITVDAKGRITAVANTTISPAWSSIASKPTTLSGFGITDAQPLDADLTAIAALTHSNRYAIFSNGSAWTTRAINAATDFSGITPVANGGTGNSSYTDGQILFGNNTTNINTSSQLFWDNTNKWLKIGVGTPAYPLDVFGTARISGVVQFTNTTQSTSPTTGASVIGGGQGIGGDQHVAGFSSLGGVSGGHPAIKIKMIIGTTAATQGALSSVAHGLTSSKIKSVSLLINPSAGVGIINSYTYNNGGYNAQIYFDTTNIHVINIAGESLNILSKPFTVLITYTE